MFQMSVIRLRLTRVRRAKQLRSHPELGARSRDPLRTRFRQDYEPDPRVRDLGLEARASRLAVSKLLGDARHRKIESTGMRLHGCMYFHSLFGHAVFWALPTRARVRGTLFRDSELLT